MNSNNKASRGRPASVRSVNDSGEEYGETAYAQKERQMPYSNPVPSVANREQPAGQAQPKPRRQNSMGFDSKIVKKWLADEPASGKPASKAKVPTGNTHQRRLSASNNPPRPAADNGPRASRSSRQGSVDLPVTVQACFGHLDQSLSTSNNDVLRISTANGTNDQVRAIAQQVLAAGGSQADVNRMVATLHRRGSGSLDARRSSIIGLEAGDGYFDIETTSTGEDRFPSTPLERGEIRILNSATPGGTNTSGYASRTPGGTQSWLRTKRQRLPLSMSGPGTFKLDATVMRSKRPYMNGTPATAGVVSSANWANVHVF